mmetsp:Transcript_35831/g.48115  ORF Transcript_35831/g.48115 Transcript_35831/m.48115 type:complete len:303 (-) Transcript_35831:7-915(-)
MISCVTWVPKGAADPKPKRYEMSTAELELMKDYVNMDESLLQEEEDGGEEEIEEEEEEEETPQKVELPKIDPSTLPPELRMDDYSDDEEDEGKKNAAREAMIGSMLIGKDAMSDDEEDPNFNQGDDDDSDDDLADIPDTREFMPTNVPGLEAMGLGRNALLEDDDDDDDSDLEDTNLTADDALVLVAKTEEDFPSLEVHVYEQTTGNLYVHHDIPLPSFPLCLAHGDINNQGGAGNYCAVGTFDPGIEIWNLDVLDVLEPTCTLGGKDTSHAEELMRSNMEEAVSGSAKKKKKKKNNNNSGF